MKWVVRFLLLLVLFIILVWHPIIAYKEQSDRHLSCEREQFRRGVAYALILSEGLPPSCTNTDQKADWLYWYSTNHDVLIFRGKTNNLK